MRVTVEVKPIKPARPFRVGDIIICRATGTLYLLTDRIGANTFRWMRLDPTAEESCPMVGAPLYVNPVNFVLYAGCVTLSNDDDC